MAWYETFFDEHYLREYETYITPERTQTQVEFIAKVLPLPDSTRMLDLCCGHGRHTVALAAMGYSMVGLDLSTVFLDIARSAAVTRRVGIQFVHADMRHIPFECEFDAIINMVTAFGYFANDTEDQKVLAAVANALKPGGRFLIDISNAPRILRDFRPQDWQELSDGSFVLTQRQYNVLTGQNEDYRLTITPDGEKRERRLTCRRYFYPELRKMLIQAGLMPIHVYGDYSCGEYTWDSARLIVLAEKPIDR